jgi:peptide/nickel transport system permease protein
MMHGDPGQSLVAGMPVRAIIAERLPHTMMLAALTAALAVPWRCSWALWRRSAAALDGPGAGPGHAVHGGMPEFLVATLGVLIFSVELTWLPSIALVSSRGQLGRYVAFLRAADPVLTVVVVAQMARMTRAAIADQLDRPYVEMARLKGARWGAWCWAMCCPIASGRLSTRWRCRSPI